MFLGKGGKIFGIEFDSSFIDIGTPEDYVNVDRFLDENALL
jgi:NDP-sugar pyrophosphorylase family protein